MMNIEVEIRAFKKLAKADLRKWIEEEKLLMLGKFVNSPHERKRSFSEYARCQNYTEKLKLFNERKRRKTLEFEKKSETKLNELMVLKPPPKSNAQKQQEYRNRIQVKIKAERAERAKSALKYQGYTQASPSLQ